MNRHCCSIALGTWMFTLACSTTAQVFAAAPQDEELDEIIVEGSREKPRRSFKDLQRPFDWLARLVGEFDIEGHVDLRASGRSEDLRTVHGWAQCVGFGSAPGVQCEVTIRWPESTGAGGEEIPGGVSTLDPAVMLFGFDPALPGVSYIVVDNKGIADIAVGRMATTDTMISRTECVAIPGNCERVVRMTARPDIETVEMKIGLEIDKVPAVNFAFVMRRVQGSESVVYGRKQKKNK